MLPRIKRSATHIAGIVGNQRGNALIMVAVAAVALFSFAIIAIDGAIMMTTKTELQNAADAAALAGASGYAVGGETEARIRAKNFAAMNVAVRETHEPVVIQDADITFPEPGQVRVVTHRTDATGDALQSYFLRIVNLFSDNTTDVTAVATAELIPLCGATCIKPWAVPDRWDDADGDQEYDQGETYADSNGNRQYDLGELFDDANGNGVWDAPEYYDPVDTGFMYPDDLGTEIVLKFGNPHDSIAPGHFFPIDLPPLGDPDQAPITGGSAYEQWIATCAPFEVEPGDSLQLEPGNMVGPTNHGMDELIALDPNAWWDEDQKIIRDSDFGKSPRIVLVPFFDPARPPVSGRNDVHVTKIGVFFIEEHTGGGTGSEVVGRFLQVGATGSPCDPGETPSGFTVGLRLVE